MALTEEATSRATSAAMGANPVQGRTAVIAMIIICAAVFLTALDQTVVVTALAPIADGLDLPPNKYLPQLSWIVSGYLLGYVIIMPLMGRVSDLVGRRRILLASLVVFGLGSLLCAEAVAMGQATDLGFLSAVGVHSPSPALTWLVIARFLQAVGGGAVVPAAIAAIGDFFGDRRRVLALGLIGGIIEAGGALGPLYGALILQRWHLFYTGPDSDWNAHFLTLDKPWQWIFLLNVPLVLALCLALGFGWPKGTATHTPGRVDWWGALLLGGALVCTSLGLGQEAGAIGSFQTAQVSQNNPLLLVAAVAFFIGFVIVESRQRDPLISLGLFRRPAFGASAVFSLFLGVALIIALVDIPLYVLDVTSTSNYLGAGFALLRMTVMIPVGALAGGWLVARFGCRAIGLTGALLTSVGFLIMHSWSSPIDWTHLTVGTMIAGLGFGLIVPPISTTALNTATAERFGMASAVVTALRMVGMILGLASLTSWGVGQYISKTNALKPPPDIAGNVVKLASWFTNQTTMIVVQIVTNFFLAGAIIAALAIIPAAFLWKSQSGEKKATEVSFFSM